MDRISSLDLDLELSWIDYKLHEISDIDGHVSDVSQNRTDDKDSITETIFDIERFIDDSYQSMLLQVNGLKDEQIIFLKKQLIDAHEIQNQMPLQSLELEPSKKKELTKNYDECHTRLCYELYLQEFQNDLKMNKKEVGVTGLLYLTMDGLKKKAIKPIFYSTKHLFKRKNSRTRSLKDMNDYNIIQV